MSSLQLAFSCLIILQFIVIAVHDLIDIPGWTHGSQVKQVIGPRKVWLATAINSLFPLTAVVLALVFWRRAAPVVARGYWLLYCAVTVLSAVFMWYVPYFRGASAETSDMYNRMYAGTRHILPPRGNNPRPNLLHICFHVLFVTTLVIAVVLWFRMG